MANFLNDKSILPIGRSGAEDKRICRIKDYIQWVQTLLQVGDVNRSFGQHIRWVHSLSKIQRDLATSTGYPWRFATRSNEVRSSSMMTQSCKSWGYVSNPMLWKKKILSSVYKPNFARLSVLFVPTCARPDWARDSLHPLSWRQKHSLLVVFDRPPTWCCMNIPWIHDAWRSSYMQSSFPWSTTMRESITTLLIFIPWIELHFENHQLLVSSVLVSLRGLWECCRKSPALCPFRLTTIATTEKGQDKKLKDEERDYPNMIREKLTGLLKHTCFPCCSLVVNDFVDVCSICALYTILFG